MKRPTIKVQFFGWRDEQITVSLTEEEMNSLINYTGKYNPSFVVNRMYNFSFWAWVDHEVSRSKRSRIYRTLNYQADYDVDWMKC